MRCPSCAMEVDPTKSNCPYCGAPISSGPQYYSQQPYPAPGYYPPPAPAYGAPPPYMAPAPYGAPPPYGYAPRPRSGSPVAAGVLMLIGGLLAMINGAVIAAVGGSTAALVPGAGAIIVVCGAIELIFGLIALVGSIMAIQRKSWGLALVGAIFCMISIGPMFIASILGLIALILVAISREEFS